jgi:hypothetical protein
MSQHSRRGRLLVADEHERRDPEVVENPLSGERITVLPCQSAGPDALVWELLLAPGGRVPSEGQAVPSPGRPHAVHAGVRGGGVVPVGSEHCGVRCSDGGPPGAAIGMGPTVPATETVR